MNLAAPMTNGSWQCVRVSFIAGGLSTRPGRAAVGTLKKTAPPPRREDKNTKPSCARIDSCKSVEIDRSGKALSPVAEPGAYIEVALSPDGKRAATAASIHHPTSISG